MHGRRRIIAPIVLLLLIGAGTAYWYVNRPAPLPPGVVTASGTIEATTVTISPEIAGRVAEVLVGEGDKVGAGDPLVRLDSTLLDAQRAQAEAAIATAQASRDLVAAGPTTEQLAVAQRQVAQARTAYAGARDVYAELSSSARRTANGKALRAQRDTAAAALATAQAQYALVAAGPRAEQVATADAQLASAKASLAVIDAQMSKLTLAAPVAGTVLTRSIEPGETVAPGAALLTLGDLDHLTLTIFVPEDRYGQVSLGEAVQVTVDSFPGQTFGGQVDKIASEAEFTPRNVQTVEGRRSTVFAIGLALDPSDGKLKPGMPADVTLGS